MTNHQDKRKGLLLLTFNAYTVSIFMEALGAMVLWLEC